MNRGVADMLLRLAVLLLLTDVAVMLTEEVLAELALLWRWLQLLLQLLLRRRFNLRGT